MAAERVLGRQEAFLRERLASAGGSGLVETSPAEQRLLALAHARAQRQAQLDRSRAATLGPTPPPGPNWTPIGPFGVLRGQAVGEPTVSGRVPSLAVSADGRRVYAATANGGVWRSLDAGASWEPMSDEFDVDPEAREVDSLAGGAIALVDRGSAAQDVLYLGTGEGNPRLNLAFGGVGLLRSANGGTTWEREQDVVSSTGGAISLVGTGSYEIAVDPGDAEHVVLASSAGLFRRRPDGPTGSRWTRERTGAHTSVVATRRGTTTTFVAHEEGATAVVSTREDGDSPTAWADPTGGAGGLPTADAERGTLAIAQAGNRVAYAVINDDRDNSLLGLFRIDLDAGGPAWVEVEGVPNVFGDQGFYDQALVVDPTNASRLWIGGKGTGEGADIRRVEVRTTSGGGFRASDDLIGRSCHADVHALVFRPGSSRELWAGCDGGVFVAQDAMASGSDVFSPRNDGLATLSLLSIAQVPDVSSYVFCGVQDNGGIRYRGDSVWEGRLLGDGGGTVAGWHGDAPDDDAPDQVTFPIVNGYIRGDLRITDTASGRNERDTETVPMGERDDPCNPGTDIDETVLFYPPIAGVDRAASRRSVGGAAPAPNPAHARRLAFGSERPWVSDDFGNTWASVPNGRLEGTTAADGDRLLPVIDGPCPPAGRFPERIRSLYWLTHELLYAGTTHGRLFRLEDDPVAGWRPGVLVDTTPSGQPITSITADTRPGLGTRDLWLTVAGTGTAHVLHATDPAAGGGAIVAADDRTPATGLPDSQANTLVVDPNDPDRLWVGLDIGVWESPDAGTTWRPLSPNLPDSAVIQLSLHEEARLLRAATHGRGVFELAVDRAVQPGVELLVRTNRADDGRGPARVTGAHPTEPGIRLAADQSPDVVIDPPDDDGSHHLPATLAPHHLAATDRPPARLVAAPGGLTATTRVHVQVHNLGVTTADAVRVVLLLRHDRAAGDGRLPADLEASVRAGTVVDADGWTTVGIRDVTGVRTGRPVSAAFSVPSTLLPPADELDDTTARLVACVHHAEDPFTGADRDAEALATGSRGAALLTVPVVAASGAAASPDPAVASSGAGAGAVPASAPDGGPLGVSQLVPAAVTVLAHRRLGDAADGIRRKVASDRVSAVRGGFTRDVAASETEHRVLALAEAARDQLRGGPAVPVGPDHLARDLGRYALLGAVGFELPAHAGLLAPGGAWVADHLRRGTADPDRSVVRVPTSALALRAGRLGLDAASTQRERDRLRAFAGGMVAATAAGVVVSPQLRDLLARETNRDWERWLPSSGARAVDRAIRERLMAGPPVVDWWPAPTDVPDVVWDGLLAAIEEQYDLPAGRRPGFQAFEEGFEAGDWLTAVRLRNAYSLLHGSWASGDWHWTAYWGLLAPIVLAPSFAMLTARALPSAKAFYDASLPLDERGVFELLVTGYAWGTLPPFVYSMLLWSQVDEHTEPFVNALVLFLARAALAAAGFATAADPGSGDVGRWLGIATPLLASDVYAAVRAGIGAATGRPGVATVFGLQTVPALSSLVTLGVSGIMRAAGARDDLAFFLTWGLFSAAMLGAAVPVAMAMADGGGWPSWFLRDDRRVGVLDSLARGARTPSPPEALARVFDDSTTFADRGEALHERSHASGTRALVRVWWPGDGTLEVAHDGDRVTLRPSTGAEQVVRIPPSGLSTVALAAAVAAALPGVETEVVGPDDPQYALPWPSTLMDPGDLGTREDHPVARTRFQRVGTSRDDAHLLRHAPRATNATAAGLRGVATSPLDAFPVVPTAGLGDLEATGLGAAADLAALLVMGAAPTLAGGTIAVPGLSPPGEVGPVHQVLRSWNLDERRLNEWRTLVAGGGDPDHRGADDPMLATAPPGHTTAHPDGAVLAAAMGWVPLWRTWLRNATDAGIDGEADVALVTTPVVSFPDGTRRRPTNAELSAGVRFLFDLPAVPP